MQGAQESHLVLLTQLKICDITFDPRTGSSAGCYLNAVANSRSQTGNQHGEGGTVHCAVDVVPTLVTQTPNLPHTREKQRVGSVPVKINLSVTANGWGGGTVEIQSWLELGHGPPVDDHMLLINRESERSKVTWTRLDLPQLEV